MGLGMSVGYEYVSMCMILHNSNYRHSAKKDPGLRLLGYDIKEKSITNKLEV